MPDEIVTKAAQQVLAARTGIAVIQAFFDAPTSTVTYVVHDTETRRAAVIDSVLAYDPASGRTSFDPADPIIDYVGNQGLTVDWHL